MRQSWMTLQERHLVVLLKWWVFLFATATIAFAAFPAHVVFWLNSIGRAIFGWPVENLPMPSEHFWRVMAVSLLCILTIMALNAQRDIRQNLGLVRLIVISKAVTTLGFLLAFILAGRYFAYLAGAIIDFIIFALTFFCYRRVISSRAP